MHNLYQYIFWMKQTIVCNQTVAALLLLTRYQSALCSLCGCLLYRHVILLQYRISDHWPGDMGQLSDWWPHVLPCVQLYWDIITMLLGYNRRSDQLLQMMGVHCADSHCHSGTRPFITLITCLLTPPASTAPCPHPVTTPSVSLEWWSCKLCKWCYYTNEK